MTLSFSQKIMIENLVRATFFDLLLHADDLRMLPGASGLAASSAFLLGKPTKNTKRRLRQADEAKEYAREYANDLLEKIKNTGRIAGI